MEPERSAPLDRAARWRLPASPSLDKELFGICLSGGGVRSASFCLGAIQRLEEGGAAGPPQSYIGGADYLATVSGGGYFAGSAQLLASFAGGATPPPYRAGSAEQDHLRRHANYLADTSSEWAVALGQAFGKLLANLVLLALVVVVVAIPLGWLGRILLGFEPAAVAPTEWPRIPEAVWYGLLLTAVPALILATARRVPATDTMRDRLRRLAGVIAIGLGTAAVVLAVTAVLLPFLDALGRQAPKWLKTSNVSVGATWPSLLVLFVLGRVKAKAMKREASGGTAPEATDQGGAAAAKKRLELPFARNLAELLAGPVLIIVALGYVAALAAVARREGLDGPAFHLGSESVATWLVFLVAAGTVLTFGYFVDAVSWSMHRFYKRRLWSAFTYDPDRGEELDWSEPTRLSVHAQKLDGRPKLVLCAAVQVSGPRLAPPGRRTVTWTFEADHVGGPEIGWCPTGTMEEALAAKGLGGDVSMFGAIAISGAAFGSAMGRHSKGTLNSVLALANARLGVWLPNPAQVAGGGWRYKRRTLWYLAKEILGRYPPDGRWLLVSDGGHFENLGLVELFRRRCTRIVCFDASGDDTGRIATLAEALRLAEEELGVVVHWPDGPPWDTAPGSTDPVGLPPGVTDAVKKRMASDPVAWGEIHYPAASGLPEGQRTGTLVVGRSVLFNTLPWEVLSYAGGHDAFPNDPTSDQWFDHEQFTNYRLLGRCIASRMIEVTGQIPRWSWPPETAPG